LSTAEVGVAKAELPGLFATDTPGRAFEKGSNLVRMIHAPHTWNDVMQRLSRYCRLVAPAEQILGSEIYVHQFKINAKLAFGGDLWQWHQDYVFWLHEDGIPMPRLVNVMVFLDEVTEFNGPLLLIPGSHSAGIISTPEASEHTVEPGDRQWDAFVSADLKYSLPKQVIAALVMQHGIVAPKGPAGSILIFHPNICHGSAPNMAPFDRSVAIVTYNSVENVPAAIAVPRPEFFAGRDYTPIVPLPEGALVDRVREFVSR
jgi:ectoine hydroxylase